MTRPDHVASYYAASANPHPAYPELTGSASADVCVVGGGYTGLTAALNLAERGLDVVLLEAARVGWGASGRNGGQINPGYAPGMAAVTRLVGREDAERLWAMAEEAKAMIRERVGRHGIDCDLADGYIYAASKPGHMAAIEAEARLLREQFGYHRVRLIGRDAAQAATGSTRFAGAMVDDGSGHLHPLNYALGLAAAAAAAGVRIHEGSRVEAITAGGRPAARTARGEVRARHLLLAGNAYLGRLAPRLQRRIMPVGTYILATEPLGQARADALIPGRQAVSDSSFVLDYFRLSADHRMLFGGRVSYLGREDWPGLGQAMRRRMLRSYPGLADVAVDYAWGGHVAISRNRLPDIGRLGGAVYYAQGFSGQGVALTGLAGKLVAEAIAGTAECFDVFARIGHRRFPGGPALRLPSLVLATTWYRLRDLLS